MLNDTRRKEILAVLGKNGSATVRELAAALYVSEATVRRDLTELQSLGLLRRSHGGAVRLEEADEVSILVRMTEKTEPKTRIGRKVAEHLPADFKTVFLDNSSTVLAVARQMDLAGKTVVTNSIQLVTVLSHVRGINLIMPGGTLSPHGRSITGSWTTRLLSEFRFDLMIASCHALDDAFSYESSLDEREIKRTVFDRSAYRILAADRSKFDRTGTYRIEPLDAYDLLVFDELPPDRESLRSLPIIV